MEEIWKDIKGYEGLYQVSTLGRVRSLDRIIQFKTRYGTIADRFIKGCIMRPAECTSEYLFIYLRKNGVKEHALVHRLVAIAFVQGEGNIVNHKDENKQNNRADNLEWCNYTYNNRYGTHTKSRKVVQFDAYGNVIAEFESLRHAESVTGIDHAYISRCCRGKGSDNISGGFIWKFKQDEKSL